MYVYIHEGLLLFRLRECFNERNTEITIELPQNIVQKFMTASNRMKRYKEITEITFKKKIKNPFTDIKNVRPSNKLWFFNLLNAYLLTFI